MKIINYLKILLKNLKYAKKFRTKNHLKEARQKAYNDSFGKK